MSIDEIKAEIEREALLLRQKKSSPTIFGRQLQIRLVVPTKDPLWKRVLNRLKPMRRLKQALF
ncbi:MAG: hypothetical protein AB7T49_03000 [Oligoflexales bacterium]